MNAENRGTIRTQWKIGDKTAVTDVTAELSLPDYQPAVRRLLRVSADCPPPESFLSAGSANVSGTLHFRVLYTGEDGGFYSASAETDYRADLRYELPAGCDAGDGIFFSAESVPESVGGRVPAPRRISLRAKVHTRGRFFASCEQTEEVGGVPEESLERLCCRAETSSTYFGVGEELLLSDEMPVEGQGEVRIISSDASVLVTEAVAGNGVVTVAGEVVLRHLLCREPAEEGGSRFSEPYRQTRRLPFRAEVGTEGSESGFASSARGFVTAVASRNEDGKILSDVSLKLCSEVSRNTPFFYTRDLYSTVSESENAYRTLSFPQSLGSVQSQFSFNASLPANAVGVRESDRVPDVTATPLQLSVTTDRRRAVLTGQLHCQAILCRSGDECSPVEFDLPFRFDLGEVKGEVRDFSLSADTLSCRLRSDGETVSVDAELFFSGMLYGAEEHTVFSSAVFSEPLPAAEAVGRLVFPAPDESLWKLARRYRVPLASLAAENALPPVAPDAGADSPESLSGVRFLFL